MTTTSISTIDAKEEFAELVSRVAHNKERIILTRRDKEVAALVPLEDLKFLEDSQNKNDLQEATEALKEARAIGTLSLDELKADIDIG
jgi:prevent-host-death family protein